MQEVSDIIKSLPKKMSLREVAKELGVSPQAVSYTERMAIWKIQKRMKEIESGISE
jgi:predicted DNA binding protein